MDQSDTNDALRAPASSARRRLLLRGGLRAAPIALTLVGSSSFGQAAASSTRCLTQANTDPLGPGNSADAFVRVPVYQITGVDSANQPVSATLVSGADLGVVATGLGTELSYSGTNGTELGDASFVLLQQQGAVIANGSAGGVYGAGDFGSNSPAPVTPETYVVVRFDSSGNVIGFFSASYNAGAGGTALTNSCQTSFAARPTA